MNNGFIWTAYGIDHEPLTGYQQIYALNSKDAWDRFKKEYGGKGSGILYLVGDTVKSFSFTID